MSHKSSNFSSGIPEFLILKLVSQEEMYGYQLVKQIKAGSNEHLDFQEGSIYPVLHSLQDKGYLSTRSEEVKNRQRVYYRLTDDGRDRLNELVDDWKNTVKGVSAIFGDENFEFVSG